jgi:ribosome-binding ATPase
MLSVGLVGLPNAGKSTLFNLLTKRAVPAENFPFCTIDPHDGIVEVKDDRLQKLSDLSKSVKIIPATIEFRDIAGLVKGAHTGAGLGNQFLSHIRECDLILMIIRTFEHDSIIHVENRVNPLEDFEILMLELTMADLKLVEGQLNKIRKELNKDKFGPQKLEILEKIEEVLTTINPANQYQLDINTTDKEVIRWRKGLNLLTDKPILKLANIITDGNNLEFKSDFKLDIGMESDLDGASSEERVEFGLSPIAGLDIIIKECFKSLNLETYLTTGVQETRAWTYTKGSTAPVCAGKIHTDFEKKYIKAEVVKYDDFIKFEGQKGASENGKLAVVGKDYIMQDGDVVEFIIDK